MDDAKFSARMSKQIPNQYIYLFNETRTYPSSSVPSFKQQYMCVYNEVPEKQLS